MAYTTIDKSSLYFNTLTYTGTGSTNTKTGVGFQPDWIWIKNRSGTEDHLLMDVVRTFAVNKGLRSNGSDEEGGVSTSTFGYPVATSDGFTATAGSTNSKLVNDSGDNYVAWNWRAGNSQGSSNTDGSINTTYTSVNTTSGFSIIKYTGNSTSGATIGHGLGAVPKVFLCKKTNSAGDNWAMYHHSLGNTISMTLNSTTSTIINAKWWNNTTPTSSVIYLGNGTEVNGNTDTFIGYAFAEKTGFSKFGSYTGNGNADGAFIYTGFKPGWIMIKRYDSGTEDWNIWDSKRIGYNISGNDKLYANLNSAELTTENAIDILSNGFKLRSTNGGFNGSGSSYIYMAFAEAPLVGSNNIPCTAR